MFNWFVLENINRSSWSVLCGGRGKSTQRKNGHKNAFQKSNQREGGKRIL